MRYILSLCIILTGFLLMSADYKTTFYLQRLNVPDLDKTIKLAYIDSLLSTDFDNTDSILSLKVDLAFDTDDHAAAIDAFEKLGDNISKFDISRQCRLRLEYIRSLRNKNQSSMGISECHKLLKLHKPDSLIYYDALVYSQIYDLVRQTSLPLREDYVAKVEEILNHARLKDLPKDYIDRINSTLHSMMMKKAIIEKDYDKALEEADILLKLPMTENEKLSLEANMAFVYMLINQMDAAEKCYQEILSSGNVSYNHGISLMNYTHMLNLQGRYDETLQMIEKHREAAEALHKDIYYSHLLGNKAIAQSKVEGFETAFNTLLINKELEDSLFFNSRIQDGLLWFDYTEKAEKLSDISSRHSRIGFRSNIFMGLMVLFIGSTLFLFLLLSRRNRKISAMGTLLDKTRAELNANKEMLSQVEENERGKAAVLLLQLAKVEEAMNSIADIASSKSGIAVDKIKLINETLSAAKREGDIREIFERQFEQSHASFFKRLYAAHPDLTPVEARMCAYLIMNLSSKEIASFTSKTIRSVEATRYRIGKKFNLPADKPLLSYLREFL